MDGNPPENPGAQPPPDPDPPKRRPTGVIRSKYEREAALVLIARMLVKGYERSKMADVTGVSEQTISKDIKEVERRWRESSFRDFDQAKAMELDRLDEIERVAWQAFEESKLIKRRTQQKIEGDDETTTKDARPKRKSNRSLVRVDERLGPGDPRFMQIILNCHVRRCMLLGLEAPQELPKSEPDSHDRYIVAARKMSDDELRTIQGMRRLLLADDRKASTA